MRFPLHQEGKDQGEIRIRSRERLPRDRISLNRDGLRAFEGANHTERLKNLFRQEAMKELKLNEISATLYIRTKLEAKK